MRISNFFDPEKGFQCELSASQNFGKCWSLSLSYSYANHSFDNLGFGVLFKTKTLNAFLVTDNIFGAIFPMSYQTAGIRGGVAFNWGEVSK